MSKFRDNTHKYLLLLGALIFLCVSTGTQACVLADHDFANPVQANAPAHIHMQRGGDHLAQTSHHETDDECCQLIQADQGSFAKAQISSSSSHPFSADWLHLQFIDTSSFHRSSFALREIISPPPEYSASPPSTAVSSLNAGRAPPSAVSA